MLDDSHLAKDTLAIVDRAGTKIQFVVASEGTINAKSYEVLMWDNEYMLVGVNAKYINEEFDTKLLSALPDYLQENDTEDEKELSRQIQDLSVQVLRDTLEHIIDDLIMSEDVPCVTANVDILIQSLLSGN